MNKKAIAILGAIFILIVGTLGFLIYSKSFSNKTPAVSNGIPPLSTSSPAGISPTPAAQATPTPAAGQNIHKLTSTQAVSPVLFFNGNGITYFDAQGNLYRADFDASSGSLQLANLKQLTLPNKTGISKVLWPQTSDNFIAQTTTNGQTGWSIYNSQTGAYIDQPAQVESIDWLPSGNQVMMIWVNNNKAGLYSSSLDGKTYSLVSNLWGTDYAISVSPDGQTVANWETQSASSTNPIYSVSSDGKIWKTLVSAGINSGALWSPDSQKFLFGKKDPATQQMQLWVYNLFTGQAESLGVNTSPDKAVWGKDSRTVYAAVPQNGGAGGNALTSDNFYSINISNLNQQQYPTGATVVDGSNLFLTADGKELFFVNAQDGILYYLNLNLN